MLDLSVGDAEKLQPLAEPGSGQVQEKVKALLAEIIASLRNPDGSVALAGFYDDVKEVDPAVKASWETLGFDGAAFLAEAEKMKLEVGPSSGEDVQALVKQVFETPQDIVDKARKATTPEE